jgi:hypothetical protein
MYEILLSNARLVIIKLRSLAKHGFFLPYLENYRRYAAAKIINTSTHKYQKNGRLLMQSTRGIYRGRTSSHTQSFLSSC